MTVFPVCGQKIKIAALRMYTCCVERVSYEQFFAGECEGSAGSCVGGRSRTPQGLPAVEGVVWVQAPAS